VTRRFFNFRYRSAAHFIDVFRTWYGPVHKAFAALSTEAAIALEQDVTALLNRRNSVVRARSSPSEYRNRYHAPLTQCRQVLKDSRA
jgi:hypothetical protein